MPRSLLFRLQDGRMRILEETVASWKREPQQAALALDVEDLIAECLSSWEDIRRAWVRTRRLATRNRLGNLQEAGTTLLDLLGRAIRLLGDVAALAEQVARQAGHPVEGQDDLAESAREATELREHVTRTWPWDNRPISVLDRKMIEESRAARARGESQDVAGLLAGLQATTAVRAE